MRQRLPLLALVLFRPALGRLPLPLPLQGAEEAEGASSSAAPAVLLLRRRPLLPRGLLLLLRDSLICSCEAEIEKYKTNECLFVVVVVKLIYSFFP